MLKGLWTLEHKGVAFDAAQGYTKGKESSKFCSKWHLQTTMRFSTRDCGEHAAIVLARAWCSKMQYLFDLALDVVDPDFSFNQADVDRWKLPDDLQALGVDKKYKGKARAHDILQIFPTL